MFIVAIFLWVRLQKREQDRVKSYFYFKKGDSRGLFLMSNVDSSDASEQSKPLSSIESPLRLDDFSKEFRLEIKDADKSEVTLELPKGDKQKIKISVEERRETARTILSIGLLALLTASLLGTAVYIIADVINPKELSQERRNMHRELITILWTSQVTLAGSALGFYFGSQKDNG